MFLDATLACYFCLLFPRGFLLDSNSPPTADTHRLELPSALQICYFVVSASRNPLSGFRNWNFARALLFTRRWSVF